MTLLHPDSDIPFHPNPGWFLGAFNCYDREETLGETLNRYDPLDPAQLQGLYDAYVFDEFNEQSGFTSAHRAAMATNLIAALSETKHDFAAYLAIDESEEEWCFPSEWAFPEPRYPFEQAYLALLRHWGMELTAMGIALPCPSLLGIHES
ncbi:hypothetical protein [Shewanella mangrovisoli]|uniref:hypothetical protein n=1 Tax=Shewanella mangrovisoli TaxID=2864211 RepID=UPI0035BB3613